MGSTGAVIFARPTLRGPKGTGGVVFFPVRSVAGLYSSSLSSSAAKKNWKPHALHPIGKTAGGDDVFIDPAWNRFQGDLANRKLGGATFPTVPDITEIFQLAQSTATAVSQIQSAQEQWITSVAQSIASILEVVQAAALAGAAQIPPVVLARQETNIPPPPDPFGGAGAGGGD